MSLSIKREVTIDLSVHELAGIFSSLDAKSQANFFHYCHQEFKLFSSEPQFQGMSKHFTSEGIEFIGRLVCLIKEGKEDTHE